MNTIDINNSIPADDQPINGATILHENRYLSSWVTPKSLELQEKYRELTKGLFDQRDKIIAVWTFVRDIPYTPFVKTKVTVDGRSFVQNDAWLDPGWSLQAGKLNCMNKSTLLASLLRQELSTEEVSVCLNNVNVDGVDGHAVVYLRLGDDYVLETTNLGIKSPFLRTRDADIYDAVLFFNDEKTRYVPGKKLREPLSLCCLRWLEGYINERLCTEYV